jgi:hypothetical protein
MMGSTHLGQRESQKNFKTEGEVWAVVVVFERIERWGLRGRSDNDDVECKGRRQTAVMRQAKEGNVVTRESS